MMGDSGEDYCLGAATLDELCGGIERYSVAC